MDDQHAEYTTKSPPPNTTQQHSTINYMDPRSFQHGPQQQYPPPQYFHPPNYMPYPQHGYPPPYYQPPPDMYPQQPYYHQYSQQGNVQHMMHSGQPVQYPMYTNSMQQQQIPPHQFGTRQSIKQSGQPGSGIQQQQKAQNPPQQKNFPPQQIPKNLPQIPKSFPSQQIPKNFPQQQIPKNVQQPGRQYPYPPTMQMPQRNSFPGNQVPMQFPYGGYMPQYGTQQINGHPSAQLPVQQPVKKDPLGELMEMTGEKIGKKEDEQNIPQNYSAQQQMPSMKHNMVSYPQHGFQKPFMQPPVSMPIQQSFPYTQQMDKQMDMAKQQQMLQQKNKQMELAPQMQSQSTQNIMGEMLFGSMQHSMKQNFPPQNIPPNISQNIPQSISQNIPQQQINLQHEMMNTQELMNTQRMEEQKTQKPSSGFDLDHLDALLKAKKQQTQPQKPEIKSESAEKKDDPSQSSDEFGEFKSANEIQQSTSEDGFQEFQSANDESFGEFQSAESNTEIANDSAITETPKQTKSIDEKPQQQTATEEKVVNQEVLTNLKPEEPISTSNDSNIETKVTEPPIFSSEKKVEEPNQTEVKKPLSSVDEFMNSALLGWTSDMKKSLKQDSKPTTQESQTNDTKPQNEVTVDENTPQQSPLTTESKPQEREVKKVDISSILNAFPESKIMNALDTAMNEEKAKSQQTTPMFSTNFASLFDGPSLQRPLEKPTEEVTKPPEEEEWSAFQSSTADEQFPTDIKQQTTETTKPETTTVEEKLSIPKLKDPDEPKPFDTMPPVEQNDKPVFNQKPVEEEEWTEFQTAGDEDWAKFDETDKTVPSEQHTPAKQDNIVEEKKPTVEPKKPNLDVFKKDILDLFSTTTKENPPNISTDFPKFNDTKPALNLDEFIQQTEEKPPKQENQLLKQLLFQERFEEAYQYHKQLEASVDNPESHWKRSRLDSFSHSEIQRLLHIFVQKDVVEEYNSEFKECRFTNIKEVEQAIIWKEKSVKRAEQILTTHVPTLRILLECLKELEMAFRFCEALNTCNPEEVDAAIESEKTRTFFKAIVLLYSIANSCIMVLASKKRFSFRAKILRNMEAFKQTAEPYLKKLKLEFNDKNEIQSTKNPCSISGLKSPDLFCVWDGVWISVPVANLWVKRISKNPPKTDSS